MPTPGIRRSQDPHDKVRHLTPHTRAHVVQWLNECGPVVVSSGYRSPSHNRRVGGVPTSWHVRARAVDVTGSRDDLVHAAGLAWALRVGPRCTGPEEVILEYLGTSRQHLHVAW